MSDLARAIEIAVDAHRGQTRRNGTPYILHPLRIMFSLETEDEMIAGVLHDVVEDSDYTLDQLRDEGFSQEILAAVKCLTKTGDIAYDAYIDRVKANPLARKVKMADLRDNMNLLELDELRESDLTRNEKYFHSFQKLSAANQTS